MLKHGNPYDNAMAENFFSILKTECIYRCKSNSLREANSMIERYIDFLTTNVSKRKQEWLHLRFAISSALSFPCTGSFLCSPFILGQYSFGGCYAGKLASAPND